MSTRGDVPVIGIVGGIGSGKSTLARRLAEQRPVVVVDGDDAGHRVLEQPEVQQKIRERFGDAVFTETGVVDRRALARQVFGDDKAQRQARADLEQIVHPHIKQELIRRIAEARRTPEIEAVLLDAAILLEAGWNDLCTAVVFVDTSHDERLRRVKAGRGWDEAELRRREASQHPPEVKQRLADFTVTNSHSLHQSLEELSQILDRVLARRL
ncbi:MAG: dephospho-CoA kinase [Planctomycetes bacterium]|nr:dephospho-CoA kinase [Planctomycetota bacterium]